MSKKLKEILGDLDEYLKTNLPLYIHNQNNVPGQDTVLYSGPYWNEKEIVAGVHALLDGAWLSAGENVSRFERAFSKMFDVKYSHMVNSGSSANLVMITALKQHFKWDDGSEIIVSPVGFPTTVAPIVQNNMVPIFIDVEYDTLNFDVNLIEARITPRTKAIFVSPVLGNPPDMDFLKALADKHGIMLVGDSCDSMGTKWDRKPLGKFYTAFSSSFYPAHHITTGEGGMISTDDEELKKMFVRISWWGRDCYCIGSANMLKCGSCKNRFSNWLEDYNGIVDHKYVFTEMGYNLKPMDLQGAIGLEQLKKFDLIDEKRKANKNRIEEIVTKYVSGVRCAHQLEKADTCWFGTPFICESQELKEKLVNFLENNKIQTRHYFAGNILLHPGYKHLGDFREFPNANKVLDTVFFLGSAPHYDERVFEYLENLLSQNWNND
jgi:CDP-6-deoxy-D-xylo-4-hexulose-3-dehydrase